MLYIPVQEARDPQKMEGVSTSQQLDSRYSGQIERQLVEWIENLRQIKE